MKLKKSIIKKKFESTKLIKVKLIKIYIYKTLSLIKLILNINWKKN